MRRIDLLVNQARRATENLSFTDDTGISDEEFLQYLNDGQERIQSKILSVHPSFFQEEKVYYIVAGQERYDLPADVFLNTRVEKVEYSTTGQNKNYYPLKQGSLYERFSGSTNNPTYYIRFSDKILVQPTPSGGGTLRVTYQKKAPRLDKRRATVDSVTLGTSTITTLNFDPTQLIDDTNILDEIFVTFIDKYGVIKMKAVPITAINTTTGLATIDSGFEFEDGETIAADDFAVLGKFSSTHSSLPDICEKYMLKYCEWNILKRDSNNGAAEKERELAMVEEDITSAYAQADDDNDFIPILDSQFIEPEEY